MPNSSSLDPQINLYSSFCFPSMDDNPPEKSSCTEILLIGASPLLWKQTDQFQTTSKVEQPLEQTTPEAAHTPPEAAHTHRGRSYSKTSLSYTQSPTVRPVSPQGHPLCPQLSCAVLHQTISPAYKSSAHSYHNPNYGRNHPHNT